MGPVESPLERPRLRPLEIFLDEREGRPLVCLRDPEGISEKVAAFPVEIASFLFRTLDGSHSQSEIELEFAKHFGAPLPRADLLRILDQLDSALFLETPRLQQRIEELTATWRAAPSRPAALAGSAYPAARSDAVSFLDAFYDGVATPAPERLRGLVIPHLDLRFGGPAAAKGLAGLAGSYRGETVVVLGVGHHLERRPYAITGKDFDTPLGTVPVDLDLHSRILQKAGSWVEDEELVHRSEHSVEFAALLLRHALPDRDLRILPVLCGSFHRYLADGEEPTADPLVDVFLETLAEEAGDALLVASVDLAHMGPRYGDTSPLGPADLERIEVKDREMLSHLLSRDASGFFASLSGCADRRRVCGMSALYSFAHLLPEGPPGRLVEYEQPTFPEDGNTVTICAARFGA